VRGWQSRTGGRRNIRGNSPKILRAASVKAERGIEDSFKTVVVFAPLLPLRVFGRIRHIVRAGATPDAGTGAALACLIKVSQSFVRSACRAEGAHPRTTKLYDRTADVITLDEVERIGIEAVFRTC
jgi:hypothetical protein